MLTTFRSPCQITNTTKTKLNLPALHEIDLMQKLGSKYNMQVIQTRTKYKAHTFDFHDVIVNRKIR